MNDTQLIFGWRPAFRIAIAIAIVNIVLAAGAWVLVAMVLNSVGNSFG